VIGFDFRVDGVGGVIVEAEAYGIDDRPPTATSVSTLEPSDVWVSPVIRTCSLVLSQQTGDDGLF